MTVMQPQDHQSADFTYRFKSGSTLTLPRFKNLMTFGRARRLRHLDETDQIFSLVEEVCDASALAVLDEMNLDETEAFMNAWQADSGVSVGESSGSSAPSTSTAPPSTTTGGLGSATQ